MDRLEALAELIKSGIPSYLSSQSEQLSFHVYHSGYWHDSGYFNSEDITVTRTGSTIFLSKNTGYFEFENNTGSQITITALAFSLGVQRIGNELIDNYSATIELEPNQILRLTEIKINVTTT